MKKCLLVLTLLLCLSLAGCWNYRELESIAMVTCAAVDLTKDGSWQLTAEIADYSLAIGKGPPGARLVSAEGATFFDAVRSMIEQSSQRLYWGDTAVFVISRDIAQRGITTVTDFILRDNEIRLNSIVIVSMEPTAQDILKLDTPNHNFRGLAICVGVQSMEQVSKTPTGYLNEFLGQLSDKGQAMVLPVASKAKTGNKQMLEIAGSACLSKGKLYGFLSPEDTMRLMLVTNKVKGGILNIKTADAAANRKDAYVALEIKKNKTKITPTYREGRFTFDIALDMQTTLSDVETKPEIMENVRLKALAQKQVEDELLSFIRQKQKDANVDLFRFGSVVERDLPNVYKQVEKNWTKYFADADVRVKVKIDIEHYADLQVKTPKEVQ